MIKKSFKKLGINLNNIYLLNNQKNKNLNYSNYYSKEDRKKK